GGGRLRRASGGHVPPERHHRPSYCQGCVHSNPCAGCTPSSSVSSVVRPVRLLLAAHRGGAALRPSSALPAGLAPLAYHVDRWQLRRVLMACTPTRHDVDDVLAAYVGTKSDAEVIRRAGAKMRQALHPK